MYTSQSNSSYPVASVTAGVHRIKITASPIGHHYHDPTNGTFSTISRPIHHATPMTNLAISRLSDKYDTPVAVVAAKVRPLLRQRSSSASSKSSRILKSAKSSHEMSCNLDGEVKGQRPAVASVLDDQELLQIELAFKSHKTFVYVCPCLANLYVTQTDLINGGRISSPRSHEW